MMRVTITGDNDFARRAAFARLVAEFEAEYSDMAIERLDGEETSPERMQEALASLPFLSPRKLVLLRSASALKTFAENIANILKDLPDTTDVIFYEPKLDKRSSYYKTLKKETDYQEYAELDGPALIAWAVQVAKERGGSIAPAAAKLLVDRVGFNQQLLKGEIEKLVAYDPMVTPETVVLLTEPLPGSTIFELLDAAFSGNQKRMFDLYHEQRSLRTEPQAIIAMLAWQLHILAVVKAGAPRSVDDIAKAAKLNPFVVRKSQAITRRLTVEHIKKLTSDLLRLDVALKTSSIDADEALQLYLLKIGNE
ncbi:MAG TPA: DNA polymerase III subunit delta [Candidatus Saccharimonadales bacterium]